MTCVSVCVCVPVCVCVFVCCLGRAPRIGSKFASFAFWSRASMTRSRVCRLARPLPYQSGELRLQVAAEVPRASRLNHAVGEIARYSVRSGKNSHHYLTEAQLPPSLSDCSD